jgi:hypothetical protein
MEQPITKSEIIIKTIPILSKTLENRGFKYIKSKEGSIKKTDFGYVKYSVPVKNFWPLYHEVGIVLTVRHDIIENIKSLFYNERFRNMEFAKTNPTLVIPLHISDNIDTVKISDEVQLNSIAHQIPQIISNEGFTLEEKYSNINNVGLYFKSEYLTNVNLPFQAYIVILISLKVSGDPDYEKYRDEIRKKTTDSPYKKAEEKEAVYECISYLDKYAT